MTDTPRTKAELLDIFATNGVGAIDAQDVRDFVVSTALPGPTFKMWRQLNGATQIPGILDGYGNMVELTELHQGPGATNGVVDMSQKTGDTRDVFEDPGGWLVTEEWLDDYQYYFYDNGPGATDLYPANTTLLLPEGRYTAHMWLSWVSSLTSGGIGAYLDLAEGPVTDSEILGIWTYDIGQTMQTTATTLITTTAYATQPLELVQERHLQLAVYGFGLNVAQKVTNLSLVIMKHE